MSRAAVILDLKFASGCVPDDANVGIGTSRVITSGISISKFQFDAKLRKHEYDLRNRSIETWIMMAR